MSVCTRVEARGKAAVGGLPISVFGSHQQVQLQCAVAACSAHMVADIACACVCVLTLGVLHGLFCASSLPAAMPLQATYSTRPMLGMAGRHTWPGLQPTCAGTHPPTALRLSSGGTQPRLPWAQASGECSGVETVFFYAVMGKGCCAAFDSSLDGGF